MAIINKAMRFVGPVILPKVSNYRRIVDTYTKFFIEEKVIKNTILYESRDGKSLTDSPFAIFDYLLKNDYEPKYTHIWVTTKGEELEKIKILYKDKSNVLFVERNSEAYLRWLTKTQYLINNSTFQPFVTIKDEQTYINTWHGTPLKTMGFDIPGNPAGAKNVVRNFFMADYLISPNNHTTEMFLKSYRLNQNYSGTIIESGYPRIDKTWEKNKDQLLKMLFEFGIELDLSKPIMLYTPTCKSGDLSISDNEVIQIHEEMSLVRKHFGEKYNVLIKVHPFLYNQASGFAPIKPYLIPDVIDTNQLLGIVDTLITDYSSIFFDFLVTDKPILFYCWDDDLYSNQRGKYFDYDELPGSVAFNIDELLHNITNIESDKSIYEKNYKVFKEKFVSYDDGNVTSRVVDIIFNKEQKQDVKIIESSNQKKRLLIYPGGMRSNGITSSFLNLVQNINYDKYDVTCFLDNIATPDQIKNTLDIPENVSLLFRFDLSNYTSKEYLQDLKIHFKGVKKGKEDKYPEHIYQREVRRLLGKQTFDIAIDFSGYSLNWSKYILATPAKIHNCYLHSDMKMDQEREVNGKKIHKINLNGIFTVYNRYDSLISVSEAICKVNAEKLAEYASSEKFVFAPNVINIKKILEIPKPIEENVNSDTEIFIRDGYLIENSDEYTVYTARPDTNYTSKIAKKFVDKKIDILGKFMVNEKKYYKFSQNHIYIGWIESDKVSVSEPKILSENKIYGFGKMNTRIGDTFSALPIGLENNIALSDASNLRNVYVDIVKEVKTQDSISVQIMVKGKELGWLPKNKVSFSSKLNSGTKKPSLSKKILRRFCYLLNQISFSKNLSTLKIKPVKKEKLTNYFENKGNKNIIAYTSPSDEAEKIELKDVSILYIESLATNSLGRWYEMITDTKEVYWIKEVDLTLSTLQSEVIITEKALLEIGTIITKEVVVYSSLENALNKIGSTVKSLPEVEIIKEVKTSSERVFLLSRWGDRELWLDRDAVTYKEKLGIYNSENTFFSYPEKDCINIVTTGRLSQEKNQIVLIEAFANLRKEKTKSHLYIIGSGPQESNLKSKIKKLKLEESVTLLGQVYYPFHFMKECDIFALTSLYEGQSMVLLEALTLQMKCVSTDIPACRDVLQNGEYGLLTKTNDVKGVTDGLISMMSKEQSDFKNFDPYKYNELALKEFYKQLEG